MPKIFLKVQGYRMGSDKLLKRNDARVAKLVDAKDLKSFGATHRVGSTPTPGTNVFSKIHPSLAPSLFWIEVAG